MARRNLVLALFAALPLSQAQPLVGQPVSAGDQVRISAIGLFPEPVEGEVLALTPDSLIATVRRERLALPLREVNGLQVATDERRHAILGAMIGAGLFFALAEFGTDPGVASVESGPINAMFTLAGAGLGLAMGSLVVSRDWGWVHLPGR